MRHCHVRLMTLRTALTRSLLKGAFWFTLAAIALAARELYVFHPDLFGV